MINPYILKQPVITEKSMRLATEQNTYTFEVDRSANKSQIKEAVEELYEVEVIKINTLTKPGSKKTTGRRRLPQFTAPTKRALIRLKTGQTIELFDLTGSQEA